ncbi:MAG: tRNA glutamyl-Q(34) synthetase GluQRS [Gammaproteobacteria bacterium]|nr:tRNA glutamyl-Q(34) synthetase GluQRS [Gammaproteobacteria bacterium]
MSERPQPYRGRFAPSPTGPLHFGSLVAAVGSYLDARQQDGEWLVRMEDLDPPREVAGAGTLILKTLERFGFEWDGPVWFQSRRHERYIEVLETLQHNGLTYRCGCSRKQIAEQGRRMGLPYGVYPGTCRCAPASVQQKHAIRLLSEGQQVEFSDRLQGIIRQDVEREVGDFVLRRADGLFAYQLAVVVDDAEQRITDVVRGSDLLDSTPRQIALQRLLGYPTPDYLHLPVALNEQGQKLSKQTLAPALQDDDPLPALWQALHFLGQNPPAELLEGELESFWRWAISHWQATALPRKLGIPCSGVS